MSRYIKDIGKITFSKCVTMMCRTGKKILKLGPNTWLREIRGADNGLLMFGVEFYNNRIVEVYPDGSILLYSRGHRTSTTKQRLSALSGTQVYSKNFCWKIGALDFYEGVNVGTVRNRKEWIERLLMVGNVKEAIRIRELTKQLADDTPCEIMADYIQDHS